MIIRMTGVAIAVASWAVVPGLWLGAAMVVGVICLVVQFLHLDAAFRDPEVPSTAPHPSHATNAEMPFVSVHVATHDEPPDMVIATLASLLALDYPNFEVIVLDNNTLSDCTWKPVAAFCDQHRETLRFFHFDQVRGAKAGALNLCLEVMRGDAQLVAIVDADYIVEPHFLRVGVEALQRNRAAFVQFPQAYRGITPDIQPIAAELEDYFNAFARRANDTRSMLLTGTLSLIKVENLISVGGWSASTVTEDAELGLRMFAAGHEGIFVDNIAGKGLLPLDFASLRTQRERWVCGNVQTMAQALGGNIGTLARRGIKSVMAQLTAWPALMAVPIVVVLMGALPMPQSQQRTLALDLAAICILASLAITALRMAVTVAVRGQPLEQVVTALAVKWSLVWPSSICWIKAVTARPLPFVKTPKTASAISSRAIPNIVLAAASLVAFGSHATHSHVLASIACVLLAGTVPAALWVDRRLSAYRPHAALPGMSGVMGAA